MRRIKNYLVLGCAIQLCPIYSYIFFSTSARVCVCVCGGDGDGVCLSMRRPQQNQIQYRQPTAHEIHLFAHTNTGRPCTKRLCARVLASVAHSAAKGEEMTRLPFNLLLYNIVLQFTQSTFAECSGAKVCACALQF